MFRVLIRRSASMKRRKHVVEENMFQVLITGTSNEYTHNMCFYREMKKIIKEVIIFVYFNVLLFF